MILCGRKPEKTLIEMRDCQKIVKWHISTKIIFYSCKNYTICRNERYTMKIFTKVLIFSTRYIIL